MHYLLIEDINSTHIPFIHDLYHEAFPVAERRDWETFMLMVGQVPEMHLQVILDDETVVGFVISWMFGEWCFIEHIAIDPLKRGKKYGDWVIKDFMTGKLILETEPPLSAIAIRRIGFYERTGMKCLRIAYRQPSYRNSIVSYPMVLMSNVSVKDKGHFNRIIKMILQKVYLNPIAIDNHS